MNFLWNFLGGLMCSNLHKVNQFCAQNTGQINPGLNYRRLQIKFSDTYKELRIICSLIEDHLELIVYSNLDFFRYVDTRNPTFDYIFLFAEETISQKSAYQPVSVALTLSLWHPLSPLFMGYGYRIFFFQKMGL